MEINKTGLVYRYYLVIKLSRETNAKIGYDFLIRVLWRDGFGSE
jgi:hypothetical protein